MNPAKIVIVTIGQPSTNPRMMKEVEALLKEGYQVKVFYGYWASWAVMADQAILARFPGVFQMVGGDPVKGKWDYFLSRVIHKGARVLGKYFPGLCRYAINRVCFFLERAVIREQADLFIGHNLGTLPVVVKAARKWNTRCGFDAEDYHRGQFVQLSGDDYRCTLQIEEKFMPACDHLTAASPLIAAAYEALLPGKKITVVNNVFSIVSLQGRRQSTARPLRLFWFSQSLGPNRGLEVIIEALNLLSGYDIRFDLVGDCPENYRLQLTGMAKKPGMLHFLPPVKPDELFGIGAAYDIGLAAEVPFEENRDLCLTNKIFTYLLAGNCILASDTKAQKRFMEENPGIGWLYRYDDPGDLADRITTAYNDPEGLQQCRDRCLALAASRFNWETEKKIFLGLIDVVLRKR